MTTKMAQVSQSLIQRIQAEEWKQGEQLPSRNQLSQEYGVSPATVVGAVKILVRKRLVKTVAGKGMFVVDPEADDAALRSRGGAWSQPASAPSAPSDSAGRPRLIGVMGAYLPDEQTIRHQGMGAVPREPIIDGIWAHAARHRCHLLLYTDHQQDVSAEQLQSMGVHGVILTGGYDLQRYEILRQAGVPTLGVNAPLGPSPLNYVDYDVPGMVRDAVDRLAGLGHKRIAFVGTEVLTPGFTDRLRLHFIDALVRNGLVYDFPAYWHTSARTKKRETYVRYAGRADRAISRQKLGREAIRSLMALPEPPTAIFCWAEDMVPAVEWEMERLGRRLPDDVAMYVCYNDAYQARYPGYLLPHEELGRLAFEHLLQSIDNPHHYVQELLPVPFCQSVGFLPHDNELHQEDRTSSASLRCNLDQGGLSCRTSSSGAISSGDSGST